MTTRRTAVADAKHYRYTSDRLHVLEVPAPSDKPLPTVEKFIYGFVRQLADVPSQRLRLKINSLILAKDDTASSELRRVISALRGVAKRFERMADELEKTNA
jgi:hypothetical protein